MKILFMTPECSNDVSWMNMHHLEQAVGGIAECAWAGPGHPLHVKGENLNDTVRRVMPGADWVIVHEAGQNKFPHSIVIPRKRIYRIAFLTTDAHWNFPHWAEKLNADKWDAVLMCTTRTAMVALPKLRKEKLRFITVEPDYYLKNVEAPIFHLAQSVNTEMFKPSDCLKEHDVSFLGAHSARYYPMRQDIWGALPSLAIHNKWRLLIRGAPPGVSLVSRNIDDLTRKGYLVGGKYAEVLALSKTLIFSTGIFRYAVKKFVEGMACRTLCLSDAPLVAEELHLILDWNFIEISRNNWRERLTYYLKHDGEREEIAENGYQTVLKYHTCEVRAKQMVEFLEEHS